MAQITIKIERDTEDEINAMLMKNQEPLVYTDYQVGKGLVLVLLDDEQSKTKSKQCFICGVFGEPKKMVKYTDYDVNRLVHPECRVLDEKRGMFRKEVS